TMFPGAASLDADGWRQVTSQEVLGPIVRRALAGLGTGDPAGTPAGSAADPASMHLAARYVASARTARRLAGEQPGTLDTLLLTADESMLAPAAFASLDWHQRF